MSKDLTFYQQQLSALHPDRSSGHAKPHKVCLILAVLDLIKQGGITENRIELNESLQESFSKYFNEYKHGNDKDDPAPPFFYLESSEFWHHKPHKEHIKEYQKRINDRKHGGSGVVDRIIEFAYVDDDLFQYMQSSVARTVLEFALQENLDDLSERFGRWALNIGKSEKTIKNYTGAINGSISKWVMDAGLSKKKVFEINSYQEYFALTKQAKKLEKFELRDSKGKGMYSSALKLYGEFLADTTQYEVGEDIQLINENPSLDNTEKTILVNTRIGQGQFRQRLINYWGGCAITGYRDPRLLIASHIKPWRAATNEERLDTFNGVLMLPNLDKVFDMGFLTFNERGKMIISTQLENHKTLGIELDMSVNLVDGHQDYMAYHREIIFKG